MSPIGTRVNGCRAGMWITWLLLFGFQALLHHSSAVCTLDEFECCLTSFGDLVRPIGIKLSEENLEKACKIKTESLSCMEVFMDQCNFTKGDEVDKAFQKTSVYLDDVCLPTSKFIKSLESHQGCILNASTKFQRCYNQTELPDQAKAEEHSCCSYKAVRNCAVQAVEDQCGAEASQLVHEEVMNVNGVVLEWFCKDIFDKCGNTAAMLASSVIFVLSTVILQRLLF